MFDLFTEQGKISEREYISRKAAKFWTIAGGTSLSSVSVGQYFVNPITWATITASLPELPDIQRSERVPEERPKKKESTLPKHWRAKPAYPGAKC
jgi:hypothetical protein